MDVPEAKEKMMRSHVSVSSDLWPSGESGMVTDVIIFGTNRNPHIGGVEYICEQTGEKTAASIHNVDAIGELSEKELCALKEQALD